MKQFLRGSRAVAVALAIAMFATPAAAQSDESEHLATARQALAALKYEQALHALEKALYSGRNGAEDMKSIYRMMGEIQAALGQQEQAEQHFRALLALEPTAELGRGVSPKIQQPFQAARTHMSTRGRLEVRCRVDEAAQLVAVEVASDPARLVAGARVIYRLPDGTEQLVEAAGRESTLLRVPASAPVTLICAALDEHRNRLAEIGSWSEPLRLSPPAPEPRPAEVALAPPAEAPAAAAPPLYGRWWVWGTAAVLAGGAGGYFGWQARADEEALDRLNENSQDHDFSEAEELEQSGRRNALIANVALGTAGAFAIAAVLSLVLEPDAPAAERTGSAALAPLPVRQGAGLSVAFTF